jgi:hypothetical protein
MCSDEPASVVPYDPGRALADLTALLRLTHFVDTMVVEESCPLIFKDEAEWWAWLWSHGSRHLSSKCPATSYRASSTPSSAASRDAAKTTG